MASKTATDYFKEGIEKGLKSLIKESDDKKGSNILLIMAPEETDKREGKTFFLAGTIDSGNSPNWQKQLYERLSKDKDLAGRLTIFNPRRDEWPDDGSDEVIRQIKWEHKHMDEADTIIMNIIGESKSPISLMEIGMYSQSGKLIVFCPEDFYRFDNVKVVCEKYDIPLHTTNDIDEIIGEIKKQITD